MNSLNNLLNNEFCRSFLYKFLCNFVKIYHKLPNPMNKFYKTVLLTGLFVGSTDLLYAYTSQFIKTGNFAAKMLQYIAGGALGLETSLQGGNGVAFLGLFFHYFIAMAFTFFFFWIFPKLKFLAFNKYLVGMLYGVFVNLTMKFLILPLSFLPKTEFNLGVSLIDWYIFGLVFGVPIAFNAYKFYKIESEK